MKKLLSLFILNFVIVLGFAQAPQGFNYQAVARNSSGVAVVSQPIGLQISLRQTTSTGTIVYTETHAVTSNNLGLVNLVVGMGTPVTGTFNTINWGAGPYFIEVSMDITGGTTYSLMGTQQLMSVPYALYAASGTAGATGATGAAGTNGTNGATGATGATGSAGANGATGPTGAAGTNGSNGATGATGTAGANGATGAAGTNGTNGATGATGTAGANGATGPTGAAGTNGTNGATGATGSAGTNGATGATGPTGAAGTNGTNGATGATGPTGSAGTNGTNGATGATGATGAAGAAGATGATGFLSNGAAAGNTTYWNGTQWVLNSSNIFNNGGNIGIGTTTPSARLHIGNGTRFVASPDASLFLQSGNGAGSARDWKIYVPMTGGYLGFRDMGFDNLNNGMASDAMVIQYVTGNVGIGTTTPASRLDVVGTFKLTDGTQGIGKVLTSDASGNASWVAPAGGGTSEYSYVYNSTAQFVIAGAAITLDSNGPATAGITHGSSSFINIANAGVYKIEFSVTANEVNQCSVYLNAVMVPGSKRASAAVNQQNTGSIIVNVPAGSTIQIYNNTATSINLPSISGASNASVTITKL